MSATATASSSSPKQSQEEIVSHFNRLRQTQRQLAAKLSELQMDLNEHKLVIETLSGVSPDRRCFRMIGGVLVERNVKEVSPALEANRDKIAKLIETMEKQLADKGKEINKYMEEHNIQVRGGATKKDAQEQEADSGDSKKASSAGVLVSAAKEAAASDS